MITVQPNQIGPQYRPFVTARGNADGSITLYFEGDIIPPATKLTLAEYAALQAKEAQDQTDAFVAKSSAKLQALVNMTPAQVQAWVTANVTNFVQAQDAIATLAVAISILARRL